MTTSATKPRLPTPERLLERAIVSCPDADQLRFTFFTYPALRDASMNLAAFMGEVVPSREDNKVPLLHATVRGAWQAYREVEREGATMKERAAAYMRALVMPLDQVNEWRVYVSIGAQNIAWRPGVESMLDFMQRYPRHRPKAIKEQYAQVDGMSARYAVAARIIDLYYVGAFGGSLHEIIEPGAAS